MHFYWVNHECLKNSSANPVPVELSFTTAALSSVFLLVTIPTNLLACLAILIDPNKDLRTQFNCFTFNLALADLLVGCVLEPTSVYAHIKEGVNTRKANYNESVSMKALHIQYFISTTASALSISALGLERYLAITSPFLYRQHFSVKLSVIMSMVIWIVAIGIGSINIFVEYILESFIFVNTVVFFTCTVVCYACFKIRSALHQASINLEEVGNRRPTEGDTQMRLTKTLMIIVGALLCCYIPVSCIIYFMNLCQQCDCKLIQWFRDVAFWLILLNSAINPFVYTIRSRSFRRAIGIIIRCKCRHN